ncbi:2899_t:CDS:1 [Acaulospora morrowiae]|uniref:2899_t:CDS:1 n=1 Tax=Acaulospora morrowiae TaxID=94023 RepID=A0A9N8ZI01_9GLOM|nr:2899_t:CDS:1 [Acaulospora morrowiae]
MPHNDDSNQNLNILHNAQNVQVQSSISSHDVSTSDKNSSNINDTIYSKVSLDKSVETTQPKISQRLEAQLSQDSTSSRVVKKNVSSDRDKVTLQSNNIFRRKNNLEKLIKDTEKLAPMLPSLSQ